MDKEESSSAASRLKAKKSNAIKEIEEWVMKDVAWNDDSRIGKLPENVTEERMFKARLYDIGKERYRYLTKNAFEVHMFIEKRKKKLALQKQNLVSYRVKSADTPQTKNSFNKRQIDTESDFASGLNAKSTNKSVQFPGSFCSSSPDPARASSRNATQNTFLLLRSQQIGNNNLNRKLPPRSAPQSRPSESEESGGFRSWVKKSKFNKYGGSTPTTTADNRFKNLEGSLSEYYIGKCSNAEVRNIVNSIESLHQPPKNFKELKPKITLKLQEFMRERGITFA